MKEVGVLILIVALLLAAVLFNAWMVMLLIGVLHAHVLTALLPASFRDSIPIAVLVSLIFGSTQSASKAR